MIEAALAILPEDPNASMATIAEHSGLGRTTVYRHFATRDELLTELYSRVIEDAREATVEVLARGLSTAETLRALAPALLAISERSRFLQAARHLGAHMVAATTVDPNLPVRRFVEAAQARGEIHSDLHPRFIVLAINGLALAATDDMHAERITPAEAGRALGETMVRAFATGR